MMDDRIRISDADRDRVTARLRDHFAEGRLTSEELDERITATLNAKTYGDLRRVMADLPEPEFAGPFGPQGGPNGPGGQAVFPQWTGQPVYAYRRGPRLLPLALAALFFALVFPGSLLFAFVFVKLLLVFWIVACVAGLFAMRGRRRERRYWTSGYGGQPRNDGWRD
jgi:Domain of unknown function (DUF1707)